MSFIFFVLAGVLLAYWGISTFQNGGNPGAQSQLMREHGVKVLGGGIVCLVLGFIF